MVRKSSLTSVSAACCNGDENEPYIGIEESRFTYGLCMAYNTKVVRKTISNVVLLQTDSPHESKKMGHLNFDRTKNGSGSGGPGKEIKAGVDVKRLSRQTPSIEISTLQQQSTCNILTLRSNQLPKQKAALACETQKGPQILSIFE